MIFLLKMRKTDQELSRDIKKNTYSSEEKKRGQPKTGHCDGAMLTVIWTLEIITLQEKANFHRHNDQDENARTSTTVQVIRRPKY